MSCNTNSIMDTTTSAQLDVFELSVYVNLLSQYCTLLCLNKHSCQFEQVRSISKWSNVSAMLVACVHLCHTTSTNKYKYIVNK